MDHYTGHDHVAPSQADIVWLEAPSNLLKQSCLCGVYEEPAKTLQLQLFAPQGLKVPALPPEGAPHL